MNKKLYLLALAFSASFTNAQTQISFEETEGFTLGTINTQNNWEVTEGRNGFLSNQIITNARASEGSYSFLNGHQTEYDEQWFPIFGASKAFETPYNDDNFTISYDVYVTQRNGADFEFSLYGINENQEYVPVVGIGMENRGYIYITKNTDYEFDYADAGMNWPINAWNNVKVEVNATQINYYLNNNLIHTTPNYAQQEIKGLTLLHNNYGGSAYYDNFRINEETLNVSAVKKDKVEIYPNPVIDKLFIDTTDQIKNIEIYSILGQLEQSSTTLKELNTSKLKSGNYVVKIIFTNGKTMTKKFIKK